MVDLGAMIRRDVPPEDVVPLARELAPLVDELWLVEDLGWAGGIAQVAAVLAATDGVRVGHGVAPAPFRNAAALAMEWGTLARAHPGRLHAGLGHGVPGWMDRIGGSPRSRLALLREVTAATRRLLAGGTVTVSGDEVHLEDVALVFPPAVVPPVSLGVSGPRSLRLSGEVADGTVLAEGTSPAQLRAAREAIDAGRAAAGVTAAHRVTVFVASWCGDPDAAPPQPEVVGDGWTATGSAPAEVAGRLRDLAAAGADALVLVPFGDAAGHIDQLALAAQDVMPLVRR
ncbi:MAG: LLM class flavin-dependent oxidoreductase [Kineosporiaceae bacterium]